MVEMTKRIAKYARVVQQGGGFSLLRSRNIGF